MQLLTEAKESWPTNLLMHSHAHPHKDSHTPHILASISLVAVLISHTLNTRTFLCAFLCLPSLLNTHAHIPIRSLLYTHTRTRNSQSLTHRPLRMTFSFPFTFTHTFFIRFPQNTHFFTHLFSHTHPLNGKDRRTWTEPWIAGNNVRISRNSFCDTCNNQTDERQSKY